MEMYGYSAGDVFGMDDLLDLSNDDHIFVSSDSTANNNNNNTFSSSSTCAAMPTHLHSPSDFTNHICVPTDQVAELEWLSDFVHHSYTDFPVTNYLAAPTTSTNFHSRSRTKRSRPPSVTNTWTASVPQQQQQQHNSYNNNNSAAAAAAGSSSDARRCTHCASEKTPQWRTGPLGPKTLCNACGVRYKSGRLVPEYRPAASPTFVLTQHSNSHRKVMELRRQKEEHDHRNYQLC